MQYSIKNYILPKAGIYVVKLLSAKKRKFIKALPIWGTRPTFGGKKIFFRSKYI